MTRMTRKECLDAAAECVLQDRAAEYGKLENNFERIADLWEAYLHAPISALDVAMMMSLLKIARAKANPAHADSFVDLAGYAACGAELAGRAEAYRQSIEAAGEEYKKLRAEAEAKDFEEQVKTRENPPEEPEGNYPENPDSSNFTEFKPGDRVQFKEHLGVKGWADARYECEHSSGYGHIVYAEGFGRIVVDPENLRPAPKAEGCEALVEHDAPQTPEKLYQHIVDCNPATFKPRTPTGEELAEMAEEEGHG